MSRKSAGIFLFRLQACVVQVFSCIRTVVPNTGRRAGRSRSPSRIRGRNWMEHQRHFDATRRNPASRQKTSPLLRWKPTSPREPCAAISLRWNGHQAVAAWNPFRRSIGQSGSISLKRAENCLPASEISSAGCYSSSDIRVPRQATARRRSIARHMDPF